MPLGGWRQLVSHCVSALGSFQWSSFVRLSLDFTLSLENLALCYCLL